MQELYTNAQMRAADRACIESGTPARLLVQRAAQAIYDAAFAGAGQGETTAAVCCGWGNNGADGLALALLLHDAGWQVCLYFPRMPERDGREEAARATAEHRHFLAQCRARGIRIRDWRTEEDAVSFSHVADCVLGTGFAGRLRVETAAFLRWIRQRRDRGAYVVSADIPSGLSGDTGLVGGDGKEEGMECVRADCTVALGGRKLGTVLAAARDVCGTVLVRDIGIPMPQSRVRLASAADFTGLFAERLHHCHKGTWGTAVLLGGCPAYSGAMKLANLAASAMRCGCGIVRLAAGESVLPAIAPYLLEATAMAMPDREGHILPTEEALSRAAAGSRSLAVGMGWGNAPENAAVLTFLLRRYAASLLIDADGLNTLSAMPPEERTRLLAETKARVLLTPHPMEFQRLSGIPMAETAAHPVETAAAYAAAQHVVLLLKGTATIITDGTHTILTDTGSGGMATAGSGDVLSGILAGLLAWLPLTVETVACGAYLAGLAGEIAAETIPTVSMIASDTVRAIPEAIRRIQQAGTAENG